jgi:hypothetical protein
MSNFVFKLNGRSLMILNYYVLFLYVLYVVCMLCHVCVVQCIVEFKSSLELALCLLYMLAKRDFFSPKFNIRLYDKNSESDYSFLPPPKSEYFFQQHWESEYFLRKKPYPTPFQVKWSLVRILFIFSSLCFS